MGRIAGDVGNDASNTTKADSDSDWHFPSSAEYTTSEDITTQVEQMYGGAFADPDKHRIIVIRRDVLA